MHTAYLCGGALRCAPQYTGKERDADGLDYFGARYYGSNMGRWMSADWSEKPFAVPYANVNGPQSLNLYFYVGNNPVTHFDLDGHMVLQGTEDVCLGQRFCDESTKPKDHKNDDKDDKKNEGLVVTPRDTGYSDVDVPGFVPSLLGFFGIELASAPTANTDDAPKEIPVPANLLWIDLAVNHSWDRHADEFESKEQLKEVLVDTVQNAKGDDVGHKKGRVGYWNDKEGVMVIQNVKNPESSTAFHPEEGRAYFDHWKRTR